MKTKTLKNFALLLRMNLLYFSGTNIYLFCFYMCDNLMLSLFFFKRIFIPNEILVITFIHAAWKVSKYGVISGPYFSAFRLNTEIYGKISVFSPNTEKYGPEIKHETTEVYNSRIIKRRSSFSIPSFFAINDFYIINTASIVYIGTDLYKKNT